MLDISEKTKVKYMQNFEMKNECHDLKANEFIFQFVKSLFLYGKSSLLYKRLKFQCGFDAEVGG